MRRPIIVNGERIASAPPRIEDQIFDSKKSRVEQKQDEFEASLQNRQSRSKRRAYDGSKFRARHKEALEMEESGDWERATAQHFVALYAILHERVYGIKPLELNDSTRSKAAIMIARSLKDHFGSDPTLMAAFIGDQWNEERATEKWRRENKREGGRLDWYRLFEGSRATKWIMNQKRTGKIK